MRRRGMGQGHGTNRRVAAIAALTAITVAAALSGCASAPARAPASADAAPAADAAPSGDAPLDLVITNGVLYDGSGQPPRRGDLGIRGDRVVAYGDLAQAPTKARYDAQGLAVAPGFINMLSWAPDSLIADGRGMSDTKQGVTLEVFGEGWSMGPLNAEMKATAEKDQGDIKYEIDWTTLGEFLDGLVARGVTPNVASFVGATTVRIHELGYADRAPTAEELERMKGLVRQAMQEGALGVGASLIYAPAFYAKTPELIALASVAGETHGGYIAHMRSEADRLLEAIDETLEISKAARVRAEIYHLKAAGERNWPKMRQAIDKIAAARAERIPISANMYTYVAGATGLDAAMPPWVQEGGLDEWVKRLRDPKTRARVVAEIRAPAKDWESLYQMAGSPERVRFIGFKNEKLKPLIGKTLAEVAALRGTSPEDTIVDLVVEDHSRVDTAYFLMSEENVKLGIAQPWVSFGSDAESSAPEGVFLKGSTHPRAYGNFARLLGHYVRDEKVLTLEEAIRRITQWPARNWQLNERGCIDTGCYADIVVFDPATIADHATFDQPMQYATGVRDVWINGARVLENGEHTGAKPGRVVRGPGYVRPR